MMGGVEGNVATPTNCIPCHVEGKKSLITERLLTERYLSPLDIAVSQGGHRLYVTAEESDKLLVVNVAEGRVENSIPMGKRPHSVILSRDGKTGYVSNQWSNSIAVIDLSSLHVVEILETGFGPSGMALDSEEEFLYVANNFSNDISVINLESGRETKRLSAGQFPYDAALSPDGHAIYVTNQITNPKPYRTPPITEVTVVDTRSQQVTERKIFHSAHVLEGIDFTPTGDWAMVTLVRPKNLIPATQVGRGWMVTYGLGIIERGGENRVIQLLLDEPNAYYSDPYDLVITPDGKKAFITHSGVDKISVVDIEALRSLVTLSTPEELVMYGNHLGISSRYVTKRISTGSNPKRMVLSPDGKRLYVAERLQDRISIIDVETLEIVDVIDLGGPEGITLVRQGQRLFHNAGYAYQSQFSCRSCHPSGHEDGLIYDLEPDGLGLNLLNNRSLRDIGNTGPFKWNGKNTSLYMMDGIRFSKWLTRTDPFPPKELMALVSYITRGIPHPPNPHRNSTGELTEVQERGKTIYERTQTNDGRLIPPESRCITCHSGDYFTDQRQTDVGTLAPDDSPNRNKFDAAHLNNIYASPPYLHDGRAATLEELWTKFNPDDKHGVANDLSKDQLNDLIEYLKSL
jgi:YVTN family beta-propeller protein